MNEVTETFQQTDRVCPKCKGEGALLTTGCFWSRTREEVVHRCYGEGECGPCPLCNPEGEAEYPGYVEDCPKCGCDKPKGGVCSECVEVKP